MCARSCCAAFTNHYRVHACAKRARVQCVPRMCAHALAAQVCGSLHMPPRACFLYHAARGCRHSPCADAGQGAPRRRAECRAHLRGDRKEGSGKLVRHPRRRRDELGALALAVRGGRLRLARVTHRHGGRPQLRERGRANGPRVARLVWDGQGEARGARGGLRGAHRLVGMRTLLQPRDERAAQVLHRDGEVAEAAGR